MVQRNHRRSKFLIIIVPLLALCFGLAGLCHAAGKVSLNTASAEELAKLKGVTPEIAKSIVEYRTANGPFKKTEDLLKVPGMDKQIFDSIAPKLDQSGDVICPVGESSEQEEEPSLAPSKC